MDAQLVRKPALIRRALGVLGVGALLLAACGGAPSRPPASATANAEANATVPSSASSAPSSEGPRETLPFVHDDWPRALAEAKKSKRLVFVDAWAPWCHSCQSMRANVLTDSSLAPMAGDFVWLSVDTEKPENDAFVRRYSNEVWPTLWVIDAESEKPVLKWGGTATAPELRELLGAVRSGGAGSAAIAAFVRGNHAAARGDTNEAEAAYRSALAADGADPAQRARVVEALAGILSAKEDQAACATLGVAYGAALPPGTSRATVLSTALACAREGKLPRERDVLVGLVSRAIDDPDSRTLADDRSALYEELFETRKDAGDAAAAKTVATAWVTFLDAEAARAPTKEARAALDPDRLSAYLAEGAPERAIPMLVASERDFPSDYNPPARLARVYLEMKRLDAAKAAIDRALARVYGPRAMRVQALAADIAKARGDRAGERAALEQALARTETAVLSPAQRRIRGGLEKRLRELPPEALRPRP